MDCRQIQDMLSAYLDGELPPEQAEAVDAHVQGCDACARELAQLKAVVEQLHRLEPERAPAGLAPSVMAAVGHAAQPPLRRKIIRFAAPLAAAATIAVVALVTLPRRAHKSAKPRPLAMKLAEEAEEEAAPQARAKPDTLTTAMLDEAPAHKAEAEKLAPAAAAKQPRSESAPAPAPMAKGLARAPAKRVTVEALPRLGVALKPQAPAPTAKLKRRARTAAKPQAQPMPHFAFKAEQAAAVRAPAEKEALVDSLAGPAPARREITVLTNDAAKARANIVKMLASHQLVSLGRVGPAASQALTYRLNEPQYASLLVKLDTAGYKLQREARKAEARAGAKHAKEATRVEGKPQARPVVIEVLIRFQPLPAPAKK